MGETARAAAVLLRCRRQVVLPVLALILSGCGSGGGAGRSHAETARAAVRSHARGPGVPATAVEVIEGWANALRTGHLEQAAAYWALPSTMINGLDSSGQPALIRIRSAHDALSADETLPCGATLSATVASAGYVKASFVLGARAGVSGAAGCSGLADVDFLIHDGHIERWLRAPTPGKAAGSTSA